MRNTSFLEGVGAVGGPACWKSFVNYRHAERALQLFPDPLFNSCLLQSLHCASSAFIWSAHHACGIRHLRIMLKTLLLMRHNNEGNRLPLVSNKRVILQDAEASFKQTGAQWSVSESTLLRHDEICESNWLYVVLQTWWKYTFKPFFLFMEKLWMHLSMRIVRLWSTECGRLLMFQIKSEGNLTAHVRVPYIP